MAVIKVPRTTADSRRPEYFGAVILVLNPDEGRLGKFCICAHLMSLADWFMAGGSWVLHG